jgi:hypothetical protein
VGAAELIRNILGKSAGESATRTNSNGAAASAAAPALTQVYLPPDLDTDDEESEPAALPENATDEELLAYAANHPLAKKAMRIFRAKIVEVKRT